MNMLLVIEIETGIDLKVKAHLQALTLEIERGTHLHVSEEYRPE